MRPVTDLQRRVAPFKVESDYEPAGDQPAAIAEIVERINAGVKDVVLLGATGTGKTATVAWVTEQLQRPVLVLQPNKTLAAQFANELRQLFPHNAIEYFVSYYDYYQPERRRHRSRCASYLHARSVEQPGLAWVTPRSRPAVGGGS